MIVFFVGFAESWVLVFSSGFQDTDGQIAAMAATMLRLLALDTIANSCKLILGGSLRAAGDTTWVMWVSIAIHWAMAVVVVFLARVAGVSLIAVSVMVLKGLPIQWGIRRSAAGAGIYLCAHPAAQRPSRGLWPARLRPRPDAGRNPGTMVLKSLRYLQELRDKVYSEPQWVPPLARGEGSEEAG